MWVRHSDRFRSCNDASSWQSKFASGARQAKQEYFTDGELDIIRDAQELSARIPAYFDLAERRLVILGVAEKSDKGMTAKQKPVQLGDIINNEYIVQSGLNPGEQLIVGGLQKIRDGAPVMPAPPAGAPPQGAAPQKKE